MNQFTFTGLCLIIAGMLLGCGACSAAGTESRISWDAGCTASSPDTANGWIVWEQVCGAQSFIGIYRYSTGEGLLAPNVTYHPHMPAVDGNLLVWDEGGNAIYYTDLSVRPLVPHRVPAGISEKSSPSVNGTRIVWQDKTAASADYDIMMYDISDSRIYDLTPFLDGSDQKYPTIAGPYVVWEDSRNSTEIQYKNTLDWSDNLVPADPMGSYPAQPVIQGDSIVWHSDTSDIFLYNIPSNTLTQVTADGTGTNQATPDIYTTILVWKDDGFSMLPGFGIYDIAYSELDPPLTERITDADTTAFIPADINWRPRITSDDRVIWEDQRDDAPTYAATQIYMFSRNVNEPCLADFTAPSAGSRNTPISFTDASTGNIDQWAWDFGDGSSSTDQNPAHTYATSGTYPVTLTISNPYCRSRTAAWPIVVDRMPQASFTADITTGMVPLAVRFTNTSRGWQTGLDWDFGDGIAVNSTETNPVHTYTTGGTYTVLLFASNTYGTSTERKNSFIHALSGGTMTLSSDITGISITPAGDQDQLSFDTSIITDYIFDPANNTVLTCVPPPGNGISQITFFSSDGAGFTQTGPLISGVVSRTNLMSDLLPLTDFTDPSLGTMSSVNYSLDYPGYPALATVTTEVYDDTLPDYGLISTTMHSNGFTSANGIPYIIRFRKTNLNDPFQATIRMSVDSAWAVAHGWRTDHINTFRITDDELYGEILPASFVIHDAGNNLDYYIASSPHGLSKFAFSDLSGTGNLFQMAYLGVTEHFSGPSSDSDSATGTTGQGLTSQQNQPQLNEPQLNPPQSAATSVDLYINSLGVVTQTSILKSSDQLATVAIGQGVTALDANGNPLSSISIEPVSADDIAGMPSVGDLSFGGLAFNLQPEGAVFSPAITITFNVPDARWSQQYTIREFDIKTGTWIDLPTTYNPETGTVSASVSHFCTVAIFTSGIPAVSGTPAQSKTMAAPLEPIPTPATSSQIGILYNMATFVTGLIIRNIYVVIIIIAIAVVFYLRGRRGKLDRIRFML